MIQVNNHMVESFEYIAKDKCTGEPSVHMKYFIVAKDGSLIGPCYSRVVNNKEREAAIEYFKPNKGEIGRKAIWMLMHDMEWEGEVDENEEQDN